MVCIFGVLSEEGSELGYWARTQRSNQASVRRRGGGGMLKTIEEHYSLGTSTYF